MSVHSSRDLAFIATIVLLLPWAAAFSADAPAAPTKAVAPHSSHPVATPAPSDQELIAQAVALLNQGKTKEGAALLGKPLRSSDPYTKSAAQFIAGHCLLRVNQMPQAIQMWMSIAKPARENPQTAHYYYAARIEALKLFVDGTAEWPDPPQPDRNGGPSPAAWRSLPDMLKEVLNDPPLDARQAEAALLLGQLAERENPTLALGFYRQGVEFFKRLKASPSNPEWAADTPRLLKELDAKVQACETLAKQQEEVRKQAAIQAMAEKSIDPLIRRGNQYYREAEASAKAGDFKAAVKDLREFVQSPVLGKHPRIEQARYLLGRCLLADHDRQEAYTEWNRSIELNPTGPYRAQMMLDIADGLLFEAFDVNGAEKQLDRLAATIRGLAEQPSAATQPSQAAIAQTQPSDTGNLVLDAKQYETLPATWQSAYRSLLQRSALIAWLGREPGVYDEARLDARRTAAEWLEGRSP